MNTQEPTWAKRLYRFRWPLSALVLAFVGALTAVGFGGIGRFTQQVSELGDTTNGSGAVAPLVFDPRMDLWFGPEDQEVETYNAIEDRFVAEDYIIVAFEESGDEFGAFSRESLSTIARLTEGFLRVPGVRHVRSLTSNPWIRYGDIEDELGTERGLLISDLIEGDPQELSDDAIVERMIAVLGAERTADRVGEDRVRQVLGPDAEFSNHIGEPLLLGTIIDAAGTTSAIQIQVLRPRVDEEAFAAAFEPGATRREIAPTLYSIQAQRAALRGIEHILREERGLAVATPELAGLQAWLASLPVNDERRALEAELADPSRNFMSDAQGNRVRKYFEYTPLAADGSGAMGYVDASDAANPVEAPPTFVPQPLSPYAFHLGGIPLFERNFEEVGMSDSKYMGLMFGVIALILALMFRRVSAIVTPLAVVFASVAAMVGASFAIGWLFNNMTIVGPNMLTAVAIADAIHLVASWTILRGRYDNKRALIIEVLRRNALPVFLTSVTTAVGFFSLTVSEMVPVSMFGYMTGFGTIVAYLLSMTLVPALLSLVPHRPNAVQRSGTQRVRWAENLSAWVIRKRAAIVGASSLLLVVGFVGLVNLRIDSDFRAMFPDDNPVMSDFNWIESRLGGVGDLEIVFGGQNGSALGEPERTDEERLAELRTRAAGVAAGIEEFAALDTQEQSELDRLEEKQRLWEEQRIAVSGAFLRSVDRFEARLRQEMAQSDSPLRVVTDLVSPLDILRRMHQVQNENRAAFYRVPGEQDVAADQGASKLSFDEWTEEWLLVPGQTASTLAGQYYLQYENGARPGENLSTQVSMNRTQFRIQGRIEQSPSETMVAAAARIREIARDEFPELAANVGLGASENVASAASTMDISGKMLLFARTNRIFTEGFVQSMTIALTVITLLIGLMFRSARMAFVSLIPNVLPIVLPLSVFGLLNKPLDAPAIFVSSVALGVCVDDTIHFFTKFLYARRSGESVASAVRYVFETAGVAITVTSIVLVIGFGTLVLSDFSPNWMMGTLAAAMISLAWLADLIVTPAVLSFVEPEDPAPAPHPTPSTSTRCAQPVS